MLITIYNTLRKLFPPRRSHSEQALEDLYKKAPEGNMSSTEAHRAFDVANPYLRGQQMPGPSDYVSPICGNRLLTALNNDEGLEADNEYYYITSDTHKDLRVWKFVKPSHLTEQQIIEAYHAHNPGFRSWLSNNGIEDEEYDWMSR